MPQYSTKKMAAKSDNLKFTSNTTAFAAIGHCAEGQYTDNLAPE